MCLQGLFANQPPTNPLHVKCIEPAWESDVGNATITAQTHSDHAISVTDRDRKTER